MILQDLNDGRAFSNRIGIFHPERMVQTTQATIINRIDICAVLHKELNVVAVARPYLIRERGSSIVIPGIDICPGPDKFAKIVSVGQHHRSYAVVVASVYLTSSPDQQGNGLRQSSSSGDEERRFAVVIAKTHIRPMFDQRGSNGIHLRRIVLSEA